MKTAVLVLFAALVVFGTPSRCDERTFVRLDGREALPEKSCPIRVEVDLDQVVTARTHSYRTGRAARIQCDGAYLQVIEIEFLPAHDGIGAHFRVSTHVWLRAGADKLVNIDYTVLQQESLVGSGTESLKCDEGEINWEHGAEIFLREHQQPSGLRLRVEANVTDR